MSYHLTILRSNKGKQEQISSSEVKETVAAIPELEIKPAAHGCFEISSSPHYNRDILLIWQNGEIWTKNPDNDTIQIMLNLAKKLNARVRGDEFETYKTVTKSYLHPDDQALVLSTKKYTQKIILKTKHRQWLLNGIIFGIFTLIALVISYFAK